VPFVQNVKRVSYSHGMLSCHGYIPYGDINANEARAAGLPAGLEICELWRHRRYK
jgi:hypothetical protein